MFSGQLVELFVKFEGVLSVILCPVFLEWGEGEFTFGWLVI